jgi:hypothetical protein
MYSLCKKSFINNLALKPVRESEQRVLNPSTQIKLTQGK